jgi:hypothetical protein
MELNDQHRDNLHRVADAIGVKARFGMKFWIGKDKDDCGTVACIGGTAEMLLFPDPGSYVSCYVVGAELGFDSAATKALFDPFSNGWPEGSHEAETPMGATATEAAALLRGIAWGNAVFDATVNRWVWARTP